jgi:uncharacterized protein (DUF1800 family)
MKAPLALILLLAAPLYGGALDERQKAEHALNRLGFGARPGDVDRIAAMGVNRWIEQQLHPEKIADTALAEKLVKYATLEQSEREILDAMYKPILEARKNKEENKEELRELRRQSRRVIDELTAQRVLRAVESERQLNEVMIDFWMNHFNVFAGKGIDRFLLTSYERDVIRPRIWGSFEELVMATAKSPAMLAYLDNARSRRGGINENYARELMELHTLGVDGGYSQKDVTELARVLTGWSIARPKEGKSGFVFRRRAHDRDAKVVVGTKLPAGGGMDEGERMIRILAQHPSTAKHIATKLAQRLVADEPPPALVDRVAKRFIATRGDLRATVKAVIDSPEFWDAAHYRGKIKSPFEYAVSAVRAVGARVDNPLPLARELRTIGEPLYFAQPPTGYSDKAEAWMNSGAMLQRMNFAVALAANKLPGVKVAKVPALDVALSAETKKIIAGKGTDPAVTAGLILGSPEFQRQ